MSERLVPTSQVLDELSPSLSMSELKKYDLLRDQFEGASK